MMSNQEEPAYRQFEGVCRKCGNEYTYFNSVKRHRDFDICDDCEGEEVKEKLAPEERLMKVLVEGGIVLKDATPTYSELLLAVEGVIQAKVQTDCYDDRKLRKDIGQVIRGFGFHSALYHSEEITEDIIWRLVTKIIAQLPNEEGRQEGRKEVVEWIEKQGNDDGKHHAIYSFTGDYWQVKLKELCIKDE